MFVATAQARAADSIRRDVVSPTPSIGERARATAHSALRVDPDKVYFSIPEDGSTWARTEAYKVSFARDAVTYVPFFGSAAPQDYPIAMHLDSVTVGDAPIELAGDVEPQRNGDSVTFARGNVTETYALTGKQVEQTFTLKSLPGSGDLVLRIGVQTELQLGQDDAGLRFSNDLGLVTYRNAVAIDANGARAALVTNIADGEITITAPRAFLAHASLPLTIDPEIGVLSIDSSSATDFSPDTAFDRFNNVFLVAYERVFSATDHDIFASFEAQFLQGGPFDGAYVDVTGNYWAHPGVGDDAFGQKFLVACQVGLPTGGNRSIWGVVRDASSPTTSAQFQISDAAVSGDKLNVVVGSNPFPTNDDLFSVVWERAFSSADHDIHGQMVRMDATRFGGNILIDDSGAFDSNPSMSRGNDTQDWDVVWQRQASPTNHDIYGARLHWDGSITAPTFPIDTSADDTTNPAVSSPQPGTSDCMVAYEVKSGADHDIEVRRVLGTLVLGSIDVSAAEGHAALDQIQPSIDTDGTQFAVAYSEQSGPGSSDYDTYVADVHLSAGVPVLAEGHQPFGTQTTSALHSRIASYRSGGFVTPYYFVVWEEGGADVFGGEYGSFPGGPITRYCFGDGSGIACPCGNNGMTGHGCANSAFSDGAYLGTQGFAATTNDNLQLTALEMPPNSTCLFFQGTTQTGVPFGDGLRCVGGSVTRLGIVHLNSGGGVMCPNPGIHLGTLGAIPAGGATRDHQVWYRNAASFCTPSTYNLTNGVEAVWTP
jgi:hypothetical protein